MLSSPDFWKALSNSVVWVIGSLIPQFAIGFGMTPLLLQQKLSVPRHVPGSHLLSWAMSGFLIGILFRWMFDGEFGVVNDLLEKAHLIHTPIPWLANPSSAMVAIIIANVWYGVTFFTIMILAALQSVPTELYEAAVMDGAGKARTLFHVTIPYIRMTLALTVLLRVIWIFNFPDIIYGMTGGGQAGQTDIVTTYMIKLTQQGDYGTASAVGLLVVFILLLFATFYLMATRRKKEA